MKKFNFLLLISMIFGALVFYSCGDDTEEEIPGAPTVTAPSSITVAAGESVDISLTVTVPGGYASAEVSAQGGSATISDEPAEGATSGTVVVSFTAGSTAGAASVTLTVTDQNEKSGNATANLSIEEEIPGAPTVTAPSSITVAAGESVDISFTVNVPGGYASAEVSAQGGSATISDQPAEGETSGEVLVSFTAGSTAGAASVSLTVTDQNQKSGNATANLSIEEEEESVTDFDGNVYSTVIIGDQEWFVENLRTTKYNDGTDIPKVADNAEWAALTSGAYVIYPDSLIDGLNSEAEVLNAYGALYNWYAVETGKLCPEGWHVPTDAEWTALTDYLSGVTIAGGKLKSTRTEPDAHPRWNSPNTDATDEYGFSALPGGERASNGTFYVVGYYGNWWSSTEFDATNAWLIDMHYNNGTVYPNDDDKRFGFSVRCLRD